ncbi:MAG TPA: DUF4249 domain-containing protein [Mucilaginibacter sp.]|jgi:hypothetical protein
MKKKSYLLIMTICIIGCKKPYSPPVITSSSSYLVVEGVINAGSDSTVIKLSRTVNLSSKSTKNPERDAMLTVESDQNTVYPLTETKAGYYMASGLNLDTTRKYRLRIKTSNNQQYLSDYAQVKVTPPIDSIGFTVKNDGIQIYANAHDPANNTHYYLWDYNETWKFHAKYASNYITNGVAIVNRTADQFTYFCFANDTSSSIVLGSSAKLKQDVIYQGPITSIESTSEKIETEYSIQVHQYALTGDAYTFWENIKKNTEQLGSIFDAQPSNIKGNIHNVNNPAESVIGYVSVCVVRTKRIFIFNNQLPVWNPADPYNCQLDSELYMYCKPNCINQVALNLIPLGSAEIPVYEVPIGSPFPIGYMSASNYCTDCTLRGSKTQPAFWK